MKYFTKNQKSSGLSHKHLQNKDFFQIFEENLERYYTKPPIGEQTQR